MEFVAIEQFKASIDHTVDLSEYAVVAYIECINDMIRLMIDSGIEVAILVLTEVKILYDSPASPF